MVFRRLSSAFLLLALLAFDFVGGDLARVPLFKPDKSSWVVLHGQIWENNEPKEYELEVEVMDAEKPLEKPKIEWDTNKWGERQFTMTFKFKGREKLEDPVKTAIQKMKVEVCTTTVSGSLLSFRSKASRTKKEVHGTFTLQNVNSNKHYAFDVTNGLVEEEFKTFSEMHEELERRRNGGGKGKNQKKKGTKMDNDKPEEHQKGGNDRRRITHIGGSEEAEEVDERDHRRGKPQMAGGDKRRRITHIGDSDEEEADHRRKSKGTAAAEEHRRKPSLQDANDTFELEKMKKNRDGESHSKDQLGREEKKPNRWRTKQASEEDHPANGRKVGRRGEDQRRGRTTADGEDEDEEHHHRPSIGGRREDLLDGGKRRKSKVTIISGEEGPGVKSSMRRDPLGRRKGDSEEEDEAGRSHRRGREDPEKTRRLETKHWEESDENETMERKNGREGRRKGGGGRGRSEEEEMGRRKRGGNGRMGEDEVNDDDDDDERGRSSHREGRSRRKDKRRRNGGRERKWNDDDDEEEEEEDEEEMLIEVEELGEEADEADEEDDEEDERRHGRNGGTSWKHGINRHERELQDHRLGQMGESRKKLKKSRDRANKLHHPEPKGIIQGVVWNDDGLIIEDPFIKVFQNGKELRDYSVLCNGNGFFEIEVYGEYRGRVEIRYGKDSDHTEGFIEDLAVLYKASFPDHPEHEKYHGLRHKPKLDRHRRILHLHYKDYGPYMFVYHLYGVVLKMDSQHVPQVVMDTEDCVDCPYIQLEYASDHEHHVHKRCKADIDHNLDTGEFRITMRNGYGLDPERKKRMDSNYGKLNIIVALNKAELNEGIYRVYTVDVLECVRNYNKHREILFLHADKDSMSFERFDAKEAVGHKVQFQVRRYEDGPGMREQCEMLDQKPPDGESDCPWLTFKDKAGNHMLVDKHVKQQGFRLAKLTHLVEVTFRPTLVSDFYIHINCKWDSGDPSNEPDIVYHTSFHEITDEGRRDKGIEVYPLLTAPAMMERVELVPLPTKADELGFRRHKTRGSNKPKKRLSKQQQQTRKQRRQ